MLGAYCMRNYFSVIVVLTTFIHYNAGEFTMEWYRLVRFYVLGAVLLLAGSLPSTVTFGGTEGVVDDEFCEPGCFGILDGVYTRLCGDMVSIYGGPCILQDPQPGDVVSPCATPNHKCSDCECLRDWYTATYMPCSCKPGNYFEQFENN